MSRTVGAVSLVSDVPSDGVDLVSAQMNGGGAVLMPEHMLWIGVLKQALVDAVWASRTVCDAHDHHEALSFFGGASGSFHAICAALNLDAQYVQRLVRAQCADPTRIVKHYAAGRTHAAPPSRAD